MFTVEWQGYLWTTSLKHYIQFKHILSFAFRTSFVPHWRLGMTLPHIHTLLHDLYDIIHTKASLRPVTVPKIAQYSVFSTRPLKMSMIDSPGSQCHTEGPGGARGAPGGIVTCLSILTLPCLGTSVAAVHVRMPSLLRVGSAMPMSAKMLFTLHRLGGTVGPPLSFS